MTRNHGEKFWNILLKNLCCSNVVFITSSTKMEGVFNYLEMNWHYVFCCSFFQDGLKAVDNLKPSIEKLATDLHSVRDYSKALHASLILTHTTDLLVSSHFYLHKTFCFHCCVQIKQVQDEERRQLTQLRDVLKTTLQVEQKEVSPFSNQIPRNSQHFINHSTIHSVYSSRLKWFRTSAP